MDLYLSKWQYIKYKMNFIYCYSWTGKETFSIDPMFDMFIVKWLSFRFVVQPFLRTAKYLLPSTVCALSWAGTMQWVHLYQVLWEVSEIKNYIDFSFVLLFDNLIMSNLIIMFSKLLIHRLPSRNRHHFSNGWLWQCRRCRFC